MQEVVELVPFLRDPKKEVRTIAIQNLAAFCPHEEAQRLLFTSDKFVPYLKILLSDIDYIARESYIIFLQLSTNEEWAKKFIKANVINLLMETVCEKESVFKEMALLIISNLTRSEEGASKLLQLGTDYEGVFVDKLIERFCLTRPLESDPYKWIGSILTNISQLEKGREIFLKNNGNLLSLITNASSFMPDHQVRRRGLAAIIKNCCFSADVHEHLLANGILNVLLAPLLTEPSNFDADDIEKMSEPLKAISASEHYIEKDKETKSNLLESILLLCSSKKTRDILRNASVYPIIREYDKLQTDEEINQLILNIVNMLIRDEAEDETQ